MNLKEKDQQYIINTYDRMPLVAIKGKGAIVIDENGKEYIDFSSGIAANTFGFSDEYYIEAVVNQLGKLQHISNLYYTEPQIKLAELLCNKTRFSKVFFSNSGAESNEVAIKVARKYNKNKSTIITLKNSFHGRTMATLTATGQEATHQGFKPLLEGFKYINGNDVFELKALDLEGIGAFMIELVQGEGGVHVLDYEYVKEIEKICNENNILLIIDEVQTGNGRCGSLFAYMQYDIKPDIVTTAKGLGGGLPIGATLFHEKLSAVLDYGSHGSTFGGNPVCTAAAYSVFSRLDEQLLKEVREKSAYITEKLKGMDGVISVSGLGLLIGIEIEREVREVISESLEEGMIVLSAKNKLRLLPPLNISYDEIKKGLNVLEKVL